MEKAAYRNSGYKWVTLNWKHYDDDKEISCTVPSGFYESVRFWKIKHSINTGREYLKHVKWSMSTSPGLEKLLHQQNSEFRHFFEF